MARGESPFTNKIRRSRAYTSPLALVRPLRTTSYCQLQLQLHNCHDTLHDILRSRLTQPSQRSVEDLQSSLLESPPRVQASRRTNHCRLDFRSFVCSIGILFLASICCVDSAIQRGNLFLLAATDRKREHVPSHSRVAVMSCASSMGKRRLRAWYRDSPVQRLSDWIVLSASNYFKSVKNNLTQRYLHQ